MLCPKSLLKVSYKIRATFTMYDKSERLLCPFSQGLQVIEVAHDMQLAVKRYLKQDLNLVNSFDTWHGMKLTVMVFSQYVCTGVTTLHRNQECCRRARQNHKVE